MAHPCPFAGSNPAAKWRTFAEALPFSDPGSFADAHTKPVTVADPCTDPSPNAFAYSNSNSSPIHSAHFASDSHSEHAADSRSNTSAIPAAKLLADTGAKPRTVN